MDRDAIRRWSEGSTITSRVGWKTRFSRAFPASSSRSVAGQSSSGMPCRASGLPMPRSGNRSRGAASGQAAAETRRAAAGGTARARRLWNRRQEPPRCVRTRLEVAAGLGILMPLSARLLSRAAAQKSQRQMGGTGSGGWRPMVDACASFGTAETDKSRDIAGGVTAANLPHFFRNSRRALASSGSSGNSRLSLIACPNHIARTSCDPRAHRMILLRRQKS